MRNRQGLNRKAPPHTLENIRQVAEVCGVPERAETVVAQLSSRVEMVRQRVAQISHRPRCFLMEWVIRPFAPGSECDLSPSAPYSGFDTLQAAGTSGSKRSTQTLSSPDRATNFVENIELLDGILHREIFPEFGVISDHRCAVALEMNALRWSAAARLRQLCVDANASRARQCESLPVCHGTGRRPR